ncbi:MAG: hypothetical protein AAF216_09780 [Pseudomonadota bacterium]
MRTIGALGCLAALLALSGCLTDKYGTQPEVKIDPEKVEQTIADRDAANTDEEEAEPEE